MYKFISFIFKSTFLILACIGTYRFTGFILEEIDNAQEKDRLLKTTFYTRKDVQKYLTLDDLKQRWRNNEVDAKRTHLNKVIQFTAEVISVEDRNNNQVEVSLTNAEPVGFWDNTYADCIHQKSDNEIYSLRKGMKITVIGKLQRKSDLGTYIFRGCTYPNSSVNFDFLQKILSQ